MVTAMTRNRAERAINCRKSGIMKRNQGFFESGSARGHYLLTDTGNAYVRRLIGAQ